MLFVSGDPNLVEHTRQLAGDPATDSDGNAVPSQLWATQQVKNFVNVKYLALRDRLRMKGYGHGAKRTYADVVADQIFYAKPADFVRAVLVEVELDGKNLSTGSESDLSPTALKPHYGAEALKEYHQGNLSTSDRKAFIHNEHFGIVPPPDTGGTKSLRLTYEAASALLSADGDEPVFPRPYHELICYKAAISLRETKNLPTVELRATSDRLEAQAVSAMAEELEDIDYQIPAAGRVDWGLRTNMGSIKRSES